MFTGIRKNIQTSKHYLVLSLVFLLLLLCSGQELFHNHEPDLEHHHDCPAYQLYLLFSSILFLDCIYYLLLLIFVTLIFICCEQDHSFYYRNYHSRAPPFQILKIFNLNPLQNQILIHQNLKGCYSCIQISNGVLRPC